MWVLAMNLWMAGLPRSRWYGLTKSTTSKRMLSTLQFSLVPKMTSTRTCPMEPWHAWHNAMESGAIRLEHAFIDSQLGHGIPIHDVYAAAPINEGSGTLDILPLAD